MSAQPENQQMEGVQDPATDVKGKGKAQEGETVEESMDDDSSDESGAEDQAGEPEEPDEDNMEEIDTSNVLQSRTRGLEWSCIVNFRLSDFFGAFDQIFASSVFWLGL
ncbi:hypothetical protein AA0116_g11530 [Alternaria tenuissima]|nr:hypothetical protein AA0116_g11530 [Alternaria tenuissima]